MSDAMTDAIYYEEREKFFDVIQSLFHHGEYETALAVARHGRNHTLGKYVGRYDAAIRMLEAAIAKRRAQL